MSYEQYLQSQFKRGDLTLEQYRGKLYNLFNEVQCCGSRLRIDQMGYNVEEMVEGELCKARDT